LIDLPQDVEILAPIIADVELHHTILVRWPSTTRKLSPITYLQ
jgi:hypothetical protein